MTEQTKRILLAGTCFTGLAVASKYVFALDGTEFSFGQITGPLLVIHSVGIGLFVLALLLTFSHPLMAVGSGLVASLFCLPIYLYFVTPGLFRRVFPGDYSTQLASNLRWDGWAVTGVLTVLLMFYMLRIWMAAR